MAPELPPLVERLVARLARAFMPEAILLFGSRAKGVSHAGSDYDLLVIAALVGNPADHHRRARQLAADCFPPVDIVMATPAEVADAASARSPFLMSILGTGIPIYPGRGLSPAGEATRVGLTGS